MKKLKINLVMIAVILGTIGAFAFKEPTHKTTVQTDLYWFEYDASGNIIDPADEPMLSTDPFGCPKTGIVKCAAGYSEEPVKDGDVWVPQGSITQLDHKN